MDHRKKSLRIIMKYGRTKIRKVAHIFLEISHHLIDSPLTCRCMCSNRNVLLLRLQFSIAIDYTVTQYGSRFQVNDLRTSTIIIRARVDASEQWT